MPSSGFSQTLSASWICTTGIIRTARKAFDAGFETVALKPAAGLSLSEGLPTAQHTVRCAQLGCRGKGVWGKAMIESPDVPLKGRSCLTDRSKRLLRSAGKKMKT